MLYVAFTAAMVVAAALCGLHALGDRDRLAFFGTSVVYGLLLEKLVILAFEAYTYPHEEMVSVLGIPVAIGLGWSAVIYGGRATADSLGLARRHWPTFAALYGLHVDLAMDAVAIRVPYWEWIGGGPWFGVPIGNFVGWFLVAWLFVAAHHALESRAANPLVRGLGSILVAVPALVLVLEAYTRVTADVVWRQVAFFAALLLLATVHLSGADLDPRPASLPVAASAFVFHGYFLAVLLSLELYRAIPALLAVSLAMAAVGLAVHAVPSLLAGRARAGPARGAD